MQYPSSIQNLVNYFSKLPTVGPKTAERYVFYLLQQHPEELQKFAQAIAELKEKITICEYCFSVAEKSPCEICSDKKRDQNTICVVANTRDMISIESTGEFNGTYHVLGGLIDVINNRNPEILNINQLIEKIKKNKTKEIILALSPSLEGETTSMYLMKILKPLNIKISRIAKGLPVGSDIEYADEHTLSNALKYRINL